MSLCLRKISWRGHKESQTIKGKKNEMDFIKIKNFCCSKETVKKTKRQATKWEKIFLKTSDKDL